MIRLIRYIICLGVLLPCTIAVAQPGFDAANELYTKNDFKGAISAYQAILKSGVHSDDLYYNLANAYYKDNQIAQAIFYYEKALLLNPTNKSARNNLQFANQTLVDDFKLAPQVGFKPWLRGYTSVYHYDQWARIAVGFAFIAFVAFLGYLLLKNATVRRIMFAGIIASCVLMALTIGLAFFERDQIKAYNPAIVFAEVSQILSEPKADAQEVTKIHEGSKVYIQEHLAGYYKVELINGVEGWIEKSAVKSLK